MTRVVVADEYSRGRGGWRRSGVGKNPMKNIGLDEIKA